MMYTPLTRRVRLIIDRSQRAKLFSTRGNHDSPRGCGSLLKRSLGEIHSITSLREIGVRWIFLCITVRGE